MSYCRWSSDDCRCDLYIYADVSGGITIHVAGRRHVIPAEKLPPPVADVGTDEWVTRHAAVMRLVDAAPLVEIGLPHDGESYYGLSEHTAAAKVRELIALGYQCNPKVADAIEADQP